MIVMFPHRFPRTLTLHPPSDDSLVVAAVWDDAETVAEAVAALHRITGLPADA